MHIKRHILLFVCLLASTIGLTQTAEQPVLSINRTEEGSIRVIFEGENPLAGMVFGNGEVGAPDLPTLSTLIRLPKGSSLTVSTSKTFPDDIDTLFLGEKNILPITEGWAKDHPQPEYHPDEKIYSSNAYYRGGDLIEVERLGVMGSEEIFRLTVRPVAYNPVSHQLLFCKKIEATLKATKSNAWENPSESVLLIVSRPEFRTGLQPFVQWKKQEGYRVKELYVETNQRDDIKEMIRPLFENATLLDPAPSYLLLVGDAAQIQSFIGETTLESEGHPTDLYYADFSGDYLPEALLGRWPVNDTAELRTVVEKTLRYEQFLNMDTLQLKRMLLVAGKENTSPAPLTTNSQVNYLKREAKLAHPELDTLCYYNPQSGNQLDTIVADIGHGAGLLNYTAHCTVGGWTSPALSISRVGEAQGTQPMVYINNCCKSNLFSGTGFGEQLLRLPEGGGVGVIGATNSTLWNEDYYWAVGPKMPIAANAAYDSTTRGAFDALVGPEASISTLGELLTTGNMAVTASGSPYSRFYWEIYCLLGDPTLIPYIGVPRPITLTLTNELTNGASEIHVAGTPGARVTAVQDSLLLGVAVIGDNGLAVIRLQQALDTLPLLLTATGRGLQPRVDTLTVNTDIDFSATLREVAISDTMLSCVVENVGNLPINTLKIVLTQLGDDTSNGAILQEQIVIIDSLLPGAQQAVTLPVVVESIGVYPYWQATLMTWADSLAPLCDLTLRHDMAVTYPTLELHLHDSEGGEARRLLPGRSYQLIAAVTGPDGTLTMEAEPLPSQEIITTHDTLLTLTMPDSLCGLRIAANLLWERWSDHQEYWIEPGDLVDGFENGLAAHPWQNDSRHPWTLDLNESYSGTASMRSGAIDHSQSTSLCVEVLIPHSDTVSYWVKTSTETQYDKLVFSVDGTPLRPEAWGIEGWRQRIHRLQPGRHTLCWRYVKDASGSQGSDCVWIDDVRLPFSLWDSSYSWECHVANVDIDPSSPSFHHPSLTLYPNPSGGMVWMSGAAGTEVYITDLLGRTLATLRLTSDEPHLWDASGFPTGVYFAISHINDNLTTHKIILRKD